MGTIRVVPTQGAVTALVLAAVVALSACKGDSKEEARRYDAAQSSFIASVRSDAANLAHVVAPAYLERRASGEISPGADVLHQFEPQYEDFNERYCNEMKNIGKAANAGSRDLAARRVDEMRTVAADLVFDAMAAGLLQGALDAPPEQRDQVLAGLNVEAQTSDGNRVAGVAALHDADLIGSDGRLNLPELGTGQHSLYKKWISREAKGFAGRVDTLTEPTRAKLDECLPLR